MDAKVKDATEVAEVTMTADTLKAAVAQAEVAATSSEWSQPKAVEELTAFLDKYAEGHAQWTYVKCENEQVTFFRKDVTSKKNYDMLTMPIAFGAPAAVETVAHDAWDVRWPGLADSAWSEARKRFANAGHPLPARSTLVGRKSSTKSETTEASAPRAPRAAKVSVAPAPQVPAGMKRLMDAMLALDAAKAAVIEYEGKLEAAKMNVIANSKIIAEALTAMQAAYAPAEETK